ncbi:hypothetical protein LZC95_48515 [Pendulispora brunnea]|uniref:Lipoprotein n=1 Tax=Pendulispora brunnea TaxID=2905690 RepID=A0ABZ2K6G0_9BACT
MTIQRGHAWAVVISLMGASGAVACSGGETPQGAETKSALRSELRSGLISIATHRNQFGADHSAGAHIWQQERPDDCETLAAEESCKVTFCRSSDIGAVTSFSAGDIEISGARIAPPIVLNPLPGSGYTRWIGQGTIWSGGEAVRIKAAGEPGGLPAFDVDLNAPSLTVFSRPNWATGERVIDRSVDLDLAWQPENVAAGNIHARINVTQVNPHHQWWDVDCYYPVANEKGSVPARLLSMIPASEGGFGNVDFRVEAEKVSDVDGFRVKSQFWTTANFPGDIQAAGSATIK